MSGLETLLRPATVMINRQISAKTPARELCRKLADRTMALRVRNTSLTVYLIVADHELILASDYDCDNEREPDVIVSGTLVSLAKLAGPGGESVMQQGEIDLSGDVLVARQFQQLLYFGRPDLEEELSTVIGDVAAHGVGEFFRSVGNWSEDTRATMRQNVGEYLQEESRSVPTRTEVERFGKHVDTLRDDVARFEARLRNLEARLSVSDSG